MSSSRSPGRVPTSPTSSTSTSRTQLPLSPSSWRDSLSRSVHGGSSASPSLSSVRLPLRTAAAAPVVRSLSDRHVTTTSPPPTDSASTALLVEISSLRQRLLDLDDDARSSVLLGASPRSQYSTTDMGGRPDPASIIMAATCERLRLDLAKVNDEKATMELEWMNQVAQLESQLRVAATATTSKDRGAPVVVSRQSPPSLVDNTAANDWESAWLDRLDEMRSTHATQVLQLQHDLRASQQSHTQLRDEHARVQQEHARLVHAHHALQQDHDTVTTQLMEVTHQCAALKTHTADQETAMEQVRAELAHNEEQLHKCREEMGDMNDRIITLEGHKQMLVQEVTDIRQQMLRATEETAKLRTKHQHLQEEHSRLSGMAPNSSPRLRRSSLNVSTSSSPGNEAVAESLAPVTESSGVVSAVAIPLMDGARNRVNALRKALTSPSSHKTTTTAAAAAANHWTDLNGPNNTSVSSYTSSVHTAASPDRSGGGDPPSSLMDEEFPLTTAEKEQLEQDVALLEERLGTMQLKFQEKDRTIHDLAASLSDERKTNKKLKHELKALKAGDSRSVSNHPEDPISPNMTKRSMAATLAELDALRHQNQILSDTVKALEQAQQHQGNPQMPPVPPLFRDPSSEATRPRSPSPQSRFGGRPAPIVQSVPGTPVAGLVAVFERKTVTSATTPVAGSSPKAVTRGRQWEGMPSPPIHIETEPNVVSLSDYQQIQQLLEAERNVVRGLQVTLEKDRADVISLRQDLELARADATTAQTTTHDDLAAAVARTHALEAQLREREHEIDTLTRNLLQFEERHTQLQNVHEHAELDLHTYEVELDRLKREVDLQTAAADDAHNALQERLKQDARGEEKKEYDEREDERDSAKQVVILQSQMLALREELDDSLKKIDVLETEIDKLKKHLRDEQANTVELELKLSSSEETARIAMAEAAAAREASNHATNSDELEVEIDRLKVELSTVQMAKADLEMTYMNNVKELEAEIDNVAMQAEEDLDVKNTELEEAKRQLANKEDELRTVQAETHQIRSSMNDMSFTRKDEVEGLETEIMDLTSKTTTQSREIQTLKMKIEDVENQFSEKERRLQRQILELEDKLESQQWAESSEGRGVVDADEYARITAENSELRDAVRNVGAERRKLQERLENLLNEKSTSKSVQVLRDRNNALKKEVEKLTKRMKKMESSITRCVV